MKVWRVQHVRWGSTCINIYGREQDAKNRVDSVFREHLLPGLYEHLTHYFGRIEHEEYVLRGINLGKNLRSKLDAGDVWGAYQMWQDYMRSNANYNPQLPVWVEVGHIIVDASEGAGPEENPFFPVLPRPEDATQFPDPRIKKTRRP